MIVSLLLAASGLAFGGYVPPHAAADGLRFEVAAAGSTDLPEAMKACGIEDFAAAPSSGAATVYHFAVAKAREGDAQCLRQRLPAGARLSPLDHWTLDAEAH